jgi:transposase
MARPPMFKAAEKQRIVLSVLRGECSVAEAARRNKCSETSVAKWRDQFLEGGLSALEAGAPRGPSAREAQLERQLAEVTSALGERTSSCACSAATERRVWFRQEQRADDRRARCFPCAEALREPLCCSSSRRSRVGTANGMAGSEAKTPSHGAVRQCGAGPIMAALPRRGRAVTRRAAVGGTR